MPVSTVVVDEFTSAVDNLIEVDPGVFADGEVLVGLHRRLERLAAATTRATAAFDASGGGSPTAPARQRAGWPHAVACPCPTARRRVRLGRALRHLPVTEAAWLAGHIGEAQVGLLAKAATPGTAEALARDEALLVSEAMRLRFASFARVVAYWGLRAGPDGADDQSRAQHEGRRVPPVPRLRGQVVRRRRLRRGVRGHRRQRAEAHRHAVLRSRLVRGQSPCGRERGHG